MREAESEHPSPDVLQAFAAGRLDETVRSRIESHLWECDTCCDTLRELPLDTQDEQLRNLARAANDLAHPSDASRIADDSHATIPPELVDHPRYRISAVLGRGGMGVVFKAEHRLMERTVALKVIDRRLLSNPAAVKRFQLEVKAAARLSHRNIVVAHDAEHAGDVHFLVMEYVPGINLADLLRRQGRLSVLHACNYTMQTAAGLQHANEAGMVHRDIKPQNLMRNTNGTVKILDFGLARLAAEEDATRLTRAGTAIGTVDYMAPEQIEDSHQVDTRADIYSLGCTLYHLLAGQVPFPDRSPVDKLIAHARQQPRPLHTLSDMVPRPLSDRVHQMMEKDPARRPTTPAEVVRLLREYGKPQSSPQPPPPRPPEPRHHPLAAAEDAVHWLPTEVQLAPAARRTRDGWNHSLRLSVSAVAAMSAVVVAVVAGLLWWNGRRSQEKDSVPAQRLAPQELVPQELVPQELAPRSRPPQSIAQRPEQRVGHPGSPTEGSPARSTEFVSSDSVDDRWKDLLAEIRPSRQPTSGEWQQVPEGLLVSADPSAWLALPQIELPREYDVELVFTRRTGIDSIAIFFVSGTGQGSYEVDAWREHLAGIQSIAGKDLRENTTRVAGVRLENGRRYRIKLEVRRDGVTGHLDGKPLTRYRGTGSELRIEPIWGDVPRGSLALGAYLSETLFHELRLRRLN